MNIFFWQNFKEINAMRLGVLYRPIRKKFCAAVISNCEEGFTFRIDFINKLNNYKKVDMGGKCYTNIFMEKLGIKLNFCLNINFQ